MIDLICLICVDVVDSYSKSNEAVGVNSYHVSVALVILLPACEELFVYRNAFLQLFGGIIDDKQEIVADDEIDLLRIWLLNES